MAYKKSENIKLQKVANVSSVLAILFTGAALFFETWLSGATVNILIFSAVLAVALGIVIFLIIKSAEIYHKLAFIVPFILLLFYTASILVFKWNSSHYFFACLFLCTVSCLYSDFNKSLSFIIIQNISIGVLLFLDVPVFGYDVDLFSAINNWVIFLFCSLIILMITRYATVILNRAIEHRNSFWNFLDTTENYIAILDQNNEIIYASKNMTVLGNIEESTLIHGRSIVDLFPGKSLKTYASKMLKEKDLYEADWEFFLNGQKRFFKATSNSMQGGSGETLVNLNDVSYIAERDEIAVIKDNIKVGLFLIDHNFIIQSNYSRYLEEMLSESNLAGKPFVDIFSSSITSSELQAIKDYFNMIIARAYDQAMLEEINPLNEIYYVNAKTGDRKIFQCSFTMVERGRDEVFLQIMIYDITTRVDLRRKLEEEEARRQEEMQPFFELLQVQPEAFNDFSGGMEYEFENIYKTLKNEEFSTHDALAKVFQSVHAMKSNAVMLGLNIFGNKLHTLEAKVKRLRDMTEAVPFAEMLNLTMDIEKISVENERFKEIIVRIQAYGNIAADEDTQSLHALVESLTKCASKAGEDMEKRIKFVTADIDAGAINRGPKRIIKDILMQLIRNSAVHGIEYPDVRKQKGKNETGTIKLSIKMSEDYESIHIKLSDDGMGLDYRKIAERAIANNLIKREDAKNKDMLIKAIFMPGFSALSENKETSEGLGMGLNLVRERVKKINGLMKLRSETDKGTLFFISIPVPSRQKRRADA